jgi:purine-binding chemotaxis protein CheW
MEQPLRERDPAPERARERADRGTSSGSPNVTAPPFDPQGAELRAEDLERLEDLLRAELAATAAAGPAFRPPAAPAGPTDPLDEFFWREDEQAPLLPEILAAAPAQRTVALPEQRREWLTFFLGGEEYALEIEQVREILKAPAITQVPRAPAHVLGVIMVRGEVITVFDPRRRLGLPPATLGRQARVIVCDAGDGPRGLLVDAVSQVVRLPGSAVELRPSGVGALNGEDIAAIGRDRDRFLILLDLASLLRDGPAAEVRG